MIVRKIPQREFGRPLENMGFCKDLQGPIATCEPAGTSQEKIKRKKRPEGEETLKLSTSREFTGNIEKGENSKEPLHTKEEL